MLPPHSGRKGTKAPRQSRAHHSCEILAFDRAVNFQFSSIFTVKAWQRLCLILFVDVEQLSPCQGPESVEISQLSAIRLPLFRSLILLFWVFKPAVYSSRMKFSVWQISEIISSCCTKQKNARQHHALCIVALRTEYVGTILGAKPDVCRLQSCSSWFRSLLCTHILHLHSPSYSYACQLTAG